jgi:hypothetical protein
MVLIMARQEAGQCWKSHSLKQSQLTIFPSKIKKGDDVVVDDDDDDAVRTGVSHNQTATLCTEELFHKSER